MAALSYNFGGGSIDKSEQASVLKNGVIVESLAGDYDWEKGGSSEKYTQLLNLRSDGSASYKEESETVRERVTRTGDGKWRVKDNVVWVVIDRLKTETKILKKPIPAIPGFEDNVKVDENIAFDIPADKLKTAPPSGPTGPKNRWRRK